MDRIVSVFIIAPPGRLRDGLRVVLRANENIEIAGQADDGKAALEAVTASFPVLVLLDANLPDGEAWSILEHLKRRLPEMYCCVLVHTCDQDQRARNKGADAVLQEGFSSEQFLSVVVRAGLL
jgi:two-component system response regulator NreC